METKGLNLEQFRMQKLVTLIANLKTFQQNRIQYVKQAIEMFEEEITQLNYEDQLYRRGITATGEAVSPSYTARTISIKKSKGQITSHVTLRDTGDFHRSFYIKIGSRSAKIDAGDRKTKELKEKYDGIFGLTQENLLFVNNRYVRPELLKKLKMLT